MRIMAVFLLLLISIQGSAYECLNILSSKPDSLIISPSGEFKIITPRFIIKPITQKETKQFTQIVVQPESFVPDETSPNHSKEPTPLTHDEVKNWLLKPSQFNFNTVRSVINALPRKDWVYLYNFGVFDESGDMIATAILGEFFNVADQEILIQQNELKKEHKIFGQIGYSVAPEHQGKGVATEVVQALTNFIFNDLERTTGMHYDFISAQVHIRNNASIHILEKVGFKPTSIFSSGHEANVRVYLLKR